MIRRTAPLVALLLLGACGESDVANDAAMPATTPTTTPTTTPQDAPAATSGPAAEATDGPDEADAAPKAPLPGPFPLPDGFGEAWAPWFRHVDWIIGAEAGMTAARAAGKPMLLFYTATW